MAPHAVREGGRPRAESGGRGMDGVGRRRMIDSHGSVTDRAKKAREKVLLGSLLLSPW